MRYFIIALIIGLSLIVTPITGNSHADNIISNNKEVSFGLSFPPFSDKYSRSFTLKMLNALNIKHVRIAEDWRLRESTQGEFKWSPLDSRINWSGENDISLLITIQANGPNWACNTKLQNKQTCVLNDIDSFTAYIDNLAQRYSNKIDKIQFGNEWLSEFWFLGSADEFIQYSNIVYKSFKQHSPKEPVARWQ